MINFVDPALLVSPLRSQIITKSAGNDMSMNHNDDMIQRLEVV
jgi:hypothetical protein